MRDFYGGYIPERDLDMMTRPGELPAAEYAACDVNAGVEEHETEDQEEGKEEQPSRKEDREDRRIGIRTGDLGLGNQKGAVEYGHEKKIQHARAV